MTTLCTREGNRTPLQHFRVISGWRCFRKRHPHISESYIEFDSDSDNRESVYFRKQITFKD